MLMGEIIRQRRLVLNMTQAQLAERAGVSTPAVNKWEKGLSYPDTTILPVLARILKIDMNELFSFSREMTAEELQEFIRELSASIMSCTEEEMCSRIREKIHAYPGSAPLLYNSAGILNYACMLRRWEDEEVYALLEELMDETENADPAYRDSVREMRLSICLAREEYEDAEALLKQIRRSSIDTEATKALLASKKGNYEEAIQITLTGLLRDISSLMNKLLTVRGYAEKTGDEELEKNASELMRALRKQLDLWEYYDAENDLHEAVRACDKEQTLRAVRKILKILDEPFTVSEHPLFARAEQKGRNLPELKKTLLNEIRSGQGLGEDGFLKDDPDLIRIAEEGETE